MSLFHIFFRKTKKTEECNDPKMEIGSRGEDVIYFLNDNKICIGFTPLNKPRINSESIDKWEKGFGLTENEKEKVFIDVIQFIKKEYKKPIVIINIDDPSRNLWENLCKKYQKFIKDIEFTSDEEQMQFERNMFLDVLQSGKELAINETDIKNVQELDNFLAAHKKKRSV
jgi:hypothetical protein